MEDANWQPIVLLPARAANVDSPNRRYGAESRQLQWLAKKREKEVPVIGCAKPDFVGATADMFFGINTG